MLGSKFFALTVLLLALSLQQVLAIKCWNCASNEKQFCDDPFDPNSIKEEDKNTIYIECPARKPNSNDKDQAQRAVCKKTKEMVDDKFILTRSCHWEDVNASKNDCLQQTSPFVTTFFCETCKTDGCNGETMNSDTQSDLRCKVAKSR